MPNLPATELTIDACWRRIGVAGDRTCPELARHIHCRNCPVYAAAAQRNLQRAVDPAYRDTWARELARVAPPLRATDASAMAFRVGSEWLAVPLALLASIAPVARPHRLPHRTGGALLGIVNVDGRLVPAVSLAALLGIDAKDTPPPLGRHAFARLLVLALDGQSYALPVDEVHGVLRHASAAMRPAAAAVDRSPSPLVAGVVSDSELEAVLLDGALLQARLKEMLR
jgi:chemotaxis-related protein WspD